MTVHPRPTLAPFLFAILAGLAAAAPPIVAQPLEKRVMDHSIYEAWDTIGGEALTRDGQWALYNRYRYDRDDVLVVRSTVDGTLHTFDRGTGARFSEDSRHVVFTLRPARDSTLQARRERRPAAQMPRDTLGILDLATGEVARVPAVRSFQLPRTAGGWLAYQLERVPAPGGGQGGQAQAERTTGGAPAAGTPAAGAAARRREPGTPLVLRNLSSGEERRVEDVNAFAFSADGRRLAYATTTSDSAGDGVFVLESATGTTTTVLTGPGDYRRPTFDEAGEQLAFLTNRDEWGADAPMYAALPVAAASA
jgi:hypothetical protein